jgi:hypothetical protein
MAITPVVYIGTAQQLALPVAKHPVKSGWGEKSSETGNFYSPEQSPKSAPSQLAGARSVQHQSSGDGGP